MTQLSLPWQSTTPGDAGPYSSENWRNSYKYMIGLGGARDNVGPFLGSGTQPQDGLKVQATTPTPNGSVSVLPGSALVAGAFYLNTTNVTLTPAGNASGNPRIDTIVLRADYTAQTVRLAVLQGTPAGSPVPPALTQTFGVTWEIPLADLTLASGFTSIPNSVIQPRHDWVNAPPGVYLDSVLNNTGTLNTGDVVIWDSATDRAATTTTTADDLRVIGVWSGRTPAGLYGRVLTQGIGLVYVNAAVTRGQLLVTSTTARQAAPISAGGSRGAVIGMALETTSGAGLTVAYINTHRTRTMSYARYLDSKTSGTAPASITSGGWRTRELTTEDADPDGIGILASNQVTLQAGTYLVWAMAAATVVASNHRLRIRDVTNSVTLCQGNNGGSGTNAQPAQIILVGTFTLAAAAAVELQHWSNSTGNGGVVVTTGENEIYATVQFARFGEY